MQLDLREVRTVTLRLLDHIIEIRGVGSVALDRDYYWKVEEEERYRLDSDPTDLTVGSLLADDWDFLRPLLDPESDVVAHQLTELAPLLLWLGEQLGRELAAQGG